MMREKKIAENISKGWKLRESEVISCYEDINKQILKLCCIGTEVVKKASKADDLNIGSVYISVFESLQMVHDYVTSPATTAELLRRAYKLFREKGFLGDQDE